ncbi:LysR family transcriptional regulator [Rhodoplanes sp. Z2-YC6860]|uniref:LysR family transcriptional regulator n=1 Tax=Rhodoplanes sp. Z2-YC6860 TaxID=674703 RepID=UPI00078C5AB9|nr:LysR family transcriptional regulator [Rhodoplanes sp. Z2-YC6860]AMN40509.1 transcriptional regulator, LysR family [Rhodoplanes sp. Z2-YC6860]
MTIDYRGLNAFLNVARLGSVGAAASTLSLTQPAVSRTLRKLEQQLGVQLFVRHSTGMELTAFGRSLLPHAAALESGYHRALEEIDLLRGVSKGLARVGILPSLVPGVLPMVIKRVRETTPGLQLHVVEGPNHQLTRALVRGEIDFAIAAVTPNLLDENIRATPLATDEIRIVVRAAHPVLKMKTPTLQSLRDYDWALQERGGTIWRHFQALFAAANLELPTVAFTANSIETLTTVLASSNLVSLLPQVAIHDEGKHGALRAVPLRGARWRRELAVLRRVNTAMLPGVSAVLAEFRRALASTSAAS